MLNSFPLPVSPHLLPSPGALPGRLPLIRRRGGQPLNTNALKHGLYSARKPSPIPAVSASALIGPGFAASSKTWRQMLETCQENLYRATPNLQQKVILLLKTTQKPRGFPAALSSLRLATRLVGDLQRVELTLIKLQQPGLDLHFVAQNARRLVLYDFRSQGITRDADSFRTDRGKSDFNSPFSRGPQPASLLFTRQGYSFRENLESGDFNSPSSSHHDRLFTAGDPHPFLSSRQWAVLEPLLPPSDPVRRRGRPPADPRRLLDAIFWKFAHHARWQDLPAYYPPMLTCRRYYRRLFLSGRLATLYSALYKHLRLDGNLDLTTLVDQGCFEMSPHRLTLHSEVDLSWQFRTALLFMQHAFQVYRRFFRKHRSWSLRL